MLRDCFVPLFLSFSLLCMCSHLQSLSAWKVTLMPFQMLMTKCSGGHQTQSCPERETSTSKLILPCLAMIVMTFFFPRARFNKHMLVKYWEMLGYGELLTC